MIFVLEKLVRPSDHKLFYMIVLSIAFLQVGMVWGGGMMAIPDFPLLIFEAAFFLLYRKYLEEPAWYVYLLLPIVVSVMMLTKYHALLIVGFTVLSNLALLKKASFWGIAVLSTIIFVPHVLWQIDNDFPSVRYHLLERSSDPYSFSTMAEYLASQPFVLGPLIGILLIYAGIAQKAETTFERGLKFTVIGTYLFFLIMSIRGRIEANWTIITLVPLVCLGYRYIESRDNLLKITKYVFVISISMIVVARVIITTHLPVPGVPRFTESLTPWTWTSELKRKTGGNPAAFVNSYQKAALYEFYEGVPSFSLNNFWGRKNQYTIWDTEAEYQGKEVAYISNWEAAGLDTIRIAGEYFPYTTIEDFRSSSNLLITSDLSEPTTGVVQKSVTANLSFDFTNDRRRDLDINPSFSTTVIYGFFLGRTAVAIGDTSLRIGNSMIGSGLSYPVTIQMPNEPGRYTLYFAASTGWLSPGINSRGIDVVVGN
jgi:hypothetical protein